MSLSTYNGRLNKIVLIYYEFYLLCYKDTKKIAHLQVFYLLNVRLFLLDATKGLFQYPRKH